MYECPFCGNRNKFAFFEKDNQLVCRMCITFIMQIEKTQKDYNVELDEQDYALPFKLTQKQVEVSNQIKSKSKVNDVLVEAVCGAGKTELVIEMIGEAIQNKKRVGWAIPRRQVVLQLATRLQSIFKTLHVIPVCQGHTKVTVADLVVCTTHQLYRYYKYFDLLIIDEPDAFPFKGNDMLHRFAANSVQGTTVYLTATPSKEQLALVKKREMEHITLYERPFRNALIVPKFKMMSRLSMVFFLRKHLKNEQTQTLVFVPTIKIANQLGRMLSIPVITSKSNNKEEIIRSFQQHKTKHVITTTILERGVTFSNIHVVVVLANHRVFDMASLIQISGRVGRDKDYPYGKCVFLVDAKSKEVNQCIQRIKQANAFAYGV